MSEKLCILCKHCTIDDGRAMGTTWTGEYGSLDMECAKNHFPSGMKSYADNAVSFEGFAALETDLSNRDVVLPLWWFPLMGIGWLLIFIGIGVPDKTTRFNYIFCGILAIAIGLIVIS